jgi:hypothetical protein
MTPAEMESELSSLRTRLLQLEGRERKRAEAWKSTHTIVRWGIAVSALVALGMILNSYSSHDRNGIEIALTLLLINIPLAAVGHTLYTGFSSIDAKG